MYHKFSEVWGPEQDKRAAQLGQQLGAAFCNVGLPFVMTRHQLITLASIVEKETGAPQERPMIASVFTIA
ncbi:unnamed protein product [Sphagnum jensenii]|uniref:Uncharacterized protein n=1 Tax=Sphagnum jensenii TaxID=128206 RepID=A0ABP0V8S0_9BRYO